MDEKTGRAKCVSCGRLYIREEQNLYGICTDCIREAVRDAWREALNRASRNKNLGVD